MFGAIPLLQHLSRTEGELHRSRAILHLDTANFLSLGCPRLEPTDFIGCTVADGSGLARDPRLFWKDPSMPSWRLLFTEIKQEGPMLALVTYNALPGTALTSSHGSLLGSWK
jgi:hypothetical protein